jgi:hypothetical protein
MKTQTTRIELVAEMISDCIARAKWSPHASMGTHPLRYRVLKRDGGFVIVADNFGIEIHEVVFTGFCGFRSNFVLAISHGCDNGNPETSDVTVDESDLMSAERVAIEFTAACFKRYLEMSAMLGGW